MVVVFQELGVSEGMVVAVFVEFVVFVAFAVLEAFEGISLLDLNRRVLLPMANHHRRELLPMANHRLVVDIDRLVVDIDRLVVDNELQEMPQELPIAFELECPIGFVFVPIVVVLDAPIVPV